MSSAPAIATAVPIDYAGPRTAARTGRAERAAVIPLFLLLLLLTAITARAQHAGSDRPFFDALAFAGETPDSGRVDIYLAVPYSAVTFEHRDAGFAARYQVRMRVMRESAILFDTTFVRSVTTPQYDATVGRVPAYEFYQQRLHLPPGTYQATLELLDLQKNASVNEERTITVADYAGRPFALSSLMLVKKIREDSAGHVITPMITENVGAAEDGYFLFFEAYNHTELRDFRVVASYRNGTSVIGERQIFARTIPQGRSQQWVLMPSGQAPRGLFVVDLRVAPADDTARTLATAERTIGFEGRASGVPLAEEELNEKVAQLRYVASQGEIDAIRNAPTLLERQRRFSDFWAKLDPIAATPQNEAMEEYYGRIEYANTHFRSYSTGWLTDKGRVYVVYGPPDNISTDPFRTDGRGVETWQYYRRSIRLVFIDESGFGDYRLSTPISPGEKYRYGT